MPEEGQTDLRVYRVVEVSKRPHDVLACFRSHNMPRTTERSTSRNLTDCECRLSPQKSPQPCATVARPLHSSSTMSQLGLNRKRSSRSVNDFDSSDALRGALQSMEWSSTTSHSGSLSSAKNATWDVSSFAAKPPRQLKVDAAIIDTVAEIGLYGASTTLKKVCGDTDSALKVDMENELRRLAVLKSYRLVGSGHHPAYERLVSFASRVFKVPIAFVSVIDLENQHYLASRGLGPMDTAGSRHGSICASTISSDSDLLVIPDLTKHEVFYKHENVVEAPHLRFYASAPLVCPENFRLGTICILDTKPRPEGLSLDMKQNLREIADMIMETMVEEVRSILLERER